MFALRKFWDSTFGVPIIFGTLLLVVFSPFFYFDATFINSDIATYYYPAFDFYHRALQSGESFLWNPLIFSGFPTYLSQVGGYLDPINLAIFHFLDGFDGLHLRLFLDYFVTLVLGFAAARAWGMTRLTAFCVGLSYMVAFNETYVSNPLFANSAFAMPFFVWILGRIRHAAAPYISYGIFGGMGVGIMFISGYAQSLIMSLTLFGLLGVLYIWTLERHERKDYLKRFSITTLLMVSLGGAIGIVQIAPSMQFLDLTRRSEGISYSLASLKSVTLGDFILFLVPDYLYFPYLSEGRKALFTGSIWFLLIAANVRMLVYGYRWRRPLEIPAAFAIVGLFALLTAVKYSPIYYLLQQLPVYSLFRFSDRWMYSGVFFFSMFGGFGLDALARGALEQYMRRWMWLVLVSASAVIALFLTLNALTQPLIKMLGGMLATIFEATLHGIGPFTKDVAHYQDAFVRGLTAWREFVLISDISFGIPFFLLLSAVVLVALWLKGWVSHERFRLSVGALMVATFLSTVSFQFSNTLSRSEIASIQEQSFARYIPDSEREMYRYYPFMIDAGFREKVPPTYRLTREQDRALNELGLAAGWTNTNMFMEVSSLDGYDVFVTEEYFESLASAGSTFGGQDATRSLGDSEKLARLYGSLDVLGMMGGRYIVSGRELVNSALIPVQNFKASSLELPVYVYVNSFARPRVYIPQTVECVDEVNLPNLLARGKRDFSGRAYVQCGVGPSYQGSAAITEIEFKNGWAQISVEATSPSWVVFSESNIPGWRARVDGEVVEIAVVNGIYMGVVVPAGVHRVEFVYTGYPVI